MTSENPYAGMLSSPNRHAPRGVSLNRVRLVKLAMKLAKIRGEGLALYQPLPEAERFHASLTKIRVLDGSNRSGKTNGGAVETARILCGCDPYDKSVKKNGKALIVGLDGDHIAMMWAKCAQPGAFSKIRDEKTRFWRAVRPDPSDPTRLDPYDEAYCEQWKDAPPYIPARMIHSIAWEEKRKGIPRRVTLKNGWDSLWRSSKGDSPQGDHLNWVWIDEQIENEDFYKEARRGIVAMGEPKQHIPRMIWTATPQNLNPQLSDLRDDADAGKKYASAFKLLIANNPYISDDEKQAYYDSLSEDEREVRWFGIPAIARQRVYPGYSPQGVHGCDPFEVDISRWARYVALDPGRQHCGTVFFAVDPEQEHVWVYDAFDLRNSDAQGWAGEIAKRQHDMKFEAFVIDQQMGKQRPPGSGWNVAQQYWAALDTAGVRPKTEGPLGGFFPGSNDVAGREEAVISWLTIRGSGPFAGSPTLKVFRGVSPQLDKQFRDAIYDRGKRSKRPAQDVLVCVEYMAGFSPVYRAPVSLENAAANSAPTVFEQLKAKQARARRRNKGKNRIIR